MLCRKKLICTLEEKEMLKIEGNHLSVAGIRFKLPQNFYIDIEGMESIHPDGLRLISPEQDCRIAFMTTEVEFDTPVISLTPGQSAVFYDGDVVLGGGFIV